MPNHTKKTCQICQKSFCLKDLYPVSLVRGTVLKAALLSYPNIENDGFICFPDLHKLSSLYYEQELEGTLGKLSALEEEVVESIQKEEILSDNVNEEYEENLTFGQRLADKVAKFGGSWKFISLFTGMILVWMGINTFYLAKSAFDPYPYILLNLALSCLAALQAPVIMMSQNRQAANDRLFQENDYQVNLKAEIQIRQLNARLECFMKSNWQKLNLIEKAQEELLQELIVHLRNHKPKP